jgi:predicted phosphoribosyltransferase
MGIALPRGGVKVGSGLSKVLGAFLTTLACLPDTIRPSNPSSEHTLCAVGEQKANMVDSSW